MSSLNYKCSRKCFFTPKGAVIKLPKKATPIDFAYAVHTKVGNSAIGCTINGQHSTLQTILKNGDLVNIETSKMLLLHCTGYLRLLQVSSICNQKILAG